MIDKIKRLTKETSIYGLSIVVGRFLNFLLTPLYTNYLSENQIAFVTYIYAIIAFVNIAYSFGMESSYFRFVKKDDNDYMSDSDHEKQIFSNSYLVIVFLSILNSCILLIFAPQITNYMSQYSVDINLIRLIILLPVLDALILIPFAYLRSTRQAKKFSILRFISIFINVILNLVFLTQTKLGLWGVIYANLISSGIALLIFVPLILKHLVLKINFSRIKKMFSFGMPTVPASLSAIILQVADRPILEHLGTTKALALYGVNYRLGIPMMMFVSVFEYAWKPFYLNHYKDSDAKELFAKVFTYFTIFSMFLILLWTFSLDFIIRMPFVGGKFIGPAFWSGLPIVPIVLWGYYFNGVFTNFNAGFLIEKKTKYLPMIVGISAIVNIILNFILIPYYSFYGAAWATFFAYLIEAIIIYFYAKKVYPVKYEWNKVTKLLLASAIILLVERFLYTFNQSLFVIFSERIVLILFFILILFKFKIIKVSEFSFIKRFINK